MPDPAARPRVLLIATTFPGGERDGTPRFILARAQALASETDILVVAPSQGGDRSRRVGGVRVAWSRHLPRRLAALPGDGILATLRHAPLRWLEVPLFLVALLGRTLLAVMAHRPDVILAHWIIPAGTIGAAVGRVIRRPVILTVHGADAQATLGQVLEVVRRWTLARVDVVAAVTRELADRVGAAPERIQPSGLDFAAWGRLAGPRRPEDGRVLFVGRLVRKKGLDVLLHAVALVPDLRLRVIGDGPDRADLGRITERLSLEDRVEFFGRGSAEVVAAEMALAMVVVVPSRRAPDDDSEGFPNVITEAVAAGAPVVASRLDGVAEYLVDRRTALLVEPGDPVALAGALSDIAGDRPAAVRRAELARRDLEPRFDIAAVRRFYVGLIEEVAGTGAAR